MRESRHLPRMKIMGGILSRVRETRHGRKKKKKTCKEGQRGKLKYCSMRERIRYRVLIKSLSEILMKLGED